MIINELEHIDDRLDVVNLVQDDYYHSYERNTVCDAIVIHESAGLNPEPRLRANKWGCHFVIHADGKTEQGCDIGRACSHAPQMNRRSVGIEIINPYYPPARGLWIDAIDAPWAHKGKYLCPTLDQLEACAVLVDVLTSACWEGVEIPRAWAMSPGRFPMSAAHEFWPGAGVLPHCHSVKPLRADGPFIALYTWLRLNSGMSAERTRTMAMSLASKGKCKRVGGVWVADVGGVA